MTIIDALDEDMVETQKRGFAFDRGELGDRILSFGAPILLPDGEAIAAVGISLPDINLPENGEQLFGSFVAHAARSASEKLAKRLLAERESACQYLAHVFDILTHDISFGNSD